MLYRLFDLNIEIDEKFPQTRIRLSEYISKEKENADMIIRITDREILAEREKDSENDNCYLEMICIFRHIIEEITDFDGMFLHSAVVEKDNCGYMFTGISGAGKSTHAKGWLNYFGNSAKIVNGDKPILRFRKDGIWAYGSPWCGTEGYQVNTSVRLSAACFIQKALKNRIVPMNNNEVFKCLLNQTVIPKKPERKIRYFELMDILIKEIPFYTLECDISDEAVITAYNKMKIRE